MAAKAFTLVCGNRNYSSWSLRAWLLARAAFGANDALLRTVVVPLDQPESHPTIRQFAPEARTVPFLLAHTQQHVPRREDDAVGEVLSASSLPPVAYTVHDSLAIAETLADPRLVPHPAQGAPLWPARDKARAHARSAVCEMHSSFSALRSEMPMSIRRGGVRLSMDPTEQCRRDVDRVRSVWREALTTHADASGPYLYGHFSVADAFFAPVAFRFRTFGVEVGAETTKWMSALFSHPDVDEWEQLALAEPEGWVLPHEEPGECARVLQPRE